MKKSNKTPFMCDLFRYGGKVPLYEKRFLSLLRKCQGSGGIIRFILKCLYICHCKKRNIEFPIDVSVGSGLYIGHSFGITINPGVVIGKNCNIHKNVTIGQENRGDRKGTPTIGDNVYLGVGCIVVGNIKIGNDVLIAPGAFVNIDIPSHSIVIGNPCKTVYKENATEGYIENRI